MKKIASLLVLLLIKVMFRIFDEVVPKNPKLALFASKSGKLQNANTSEVWTTLKGFKDYSSYLVTRESNDPFALNLFSLKGLWKILRSKYVFLTHGPGDVIYAWFGSRKIVTYIGHGVPLKAFMFTNKNATKLDLFFQRLEFPGYKYVISTSKADQASLMKCFDKNEQDVLITGLPRNDLINNPSSDLASLFPSFEKRILYAPTHRDDSKAQFFPFDDINLEALNSYLKQKNYILILRGHINDKSKGLDVSASSNIKTLNFDVYPEIQNILGSFDLLVTDYSSMYIDYLLTLKPIIFIPYDLEEYINTRGMLYDYDRVSPGPKVGSQRDFIDSLEKLLNDREYYLNERIQVKKEFHLFEDNFSERVLEEVVFKSGKR